MATTLTSAFISLNDIINNFLIAYTGPGKMVPDAKRTEVIFHARRCLQEFAYDTLKSQFSTTANLVSVAADPAGSRVKFPQPTDSVAIIKVVRSANNPPSQASTLEQAGSLYTPGNIYDTLITTRDSGSGITVRVDTVTGGAAVGPIATYTIMNPGTGYSIGDIVGLVDIGGTGLNGQIKITALDFFTVPMTEVARVVATPITSLTEYSVDYATRELFFADALAGFAVEYTYLSNALTTDESAAIPKLAEEALYACMIYSIMANRDNPDPNLLQRLLISKIALLDLSKSRLVFTNFT
jgi:hypothetical protein